MDEEKIEEKEEKKSKKFNDITEKIRENPWMLATFVCGVLAVVLFVVILSGGVTGNAISSTDAGDKFLTYLEEQGVSSDDLAITGISSKSGLYEISFDYKDEPYPIPYYLTGDGNFIGMMDPITASFSNTNTDEIPKSDKPKVELFIWSYCPYGVQAQAPFAEVASLLKDNADFSVVLYYDGHGEYETQQNKIQECIQKDYKDKYWDYAEKFVKDIYPKCGESRDAECDKTESIKLMKSLGIDSDAVMSCVDSQGDALLAESSARAKEVGVSGSPSLVINSVKANPSSRTANAFKDSVCLSFNNVPEICGTELDSTSTTASGNC